MLRLRPDRSIRCSLARSFNTCSFIGSGKTHTMLGSVEKRVAGMYVLASHDIFAALKRVSSQSSYKMRVDIRIVDSFVLCSGGVRALADLRVVLRDLLREVVRLIERQIGTAAPRRCQAKHKHCRSNGTASNQCGSAPQDHRVRHVRESYL